jgi:hypothetical protein
VRTVGASRSRGTYLHRGEGQGKGGGKGGRHPALRLQPEVGGGVGQVDADPGGRHRGQEGHLRSVHRMGHGDKGVGGCLRGRGRGGGATAARADTDLGCPRLVVAVAHAERVKLALTAPAKKLARMKAATRTGCSGHPCSRTRAARVLTDERTHPTSRWPPARRPRSRCRPAPAQPPPGRRTRHRRSPCRWPRGSSRRPHPAPPRSTRRPA